MEKEIKSTEIRCDFCTGKIGFWVEAPNSTYFKNTTEFPLHLCEDCIETLKDLLSKIPRKIVADSFLKTRFAKKQLKACESCRQLFVPKTGKSRYCSTRCGNRARMQRYRANQKIIENLSKLMPGDDSSK